MDAPISKDIYENLFKNHSKKVKVFLRGSKSYGSNYDPLRDTGYTKTVLNPLFIRAIIRTVSANSLIIREMGLTESGAIQILIKDSDVEFIRLSEKILINEKEYYAYNDAVGNRLQIFPLSFGYSKIIIFRKDK
jgi:hypothetical protein